MGTDFYRRPHTSKCFGIVADWTQALNERADLAEVLDRLRRLLKADAGIIVRASTNGLVTKYVARCDSEAGKVWPSQSRSCAAVLLGENLSSARTSSVWRLSDIRSSAYGDDPLDGMDGAKDLMEVVVCPLDSNNGHIDILELHYRHRPAQHDLDLVTMMIETLSTCWRHRTPGVVAKLLTKKPKYACSASTDENDIPILDIENPAHLSRCEFRVCSLLKEGMTVNLIAKNLSIGTATVRSHLSSVFAKTGTSNQVELLHRLNKQASPVGNVATG